jgi:DNA-binding transcriptional MocR family regulator
MNWSTKLSAQAGRAKESSIRRAVAKAMRHPDMVFFAGGEPSPDLFAVDEIRAAFDAVLLDPQRAAAALQYSSSEGLPGLRDWVAQRMAATGVRCTRDNVLITSGSQQGLDFMGRLFVDPGTPVYVQTPTYAGAIQAFGAHGASFQSLWSGGSDSRDEPSRGLVYVIANCQNPSGRTLTVDERLQAIGVAARLALPIVEDDAYAGLQFEDRSLPSLMTLTLEGRPVDSGNALYLGTFSKTIAPGLRVGWVVAPAPVIERLTAIKQGADLQTSALMQMVALQLVERTGADLMRRLTAAYRCRRDAMLDALRVELGSEAVSWTHPDGGFFVWMTLPEGIDAALELDRALAAGVAYVPGQAFHADGAGHNTLRLSYSTMSPERIREGVRRLAGALKPAIARAQRQRAGAAS